MANVVKITAGIDWITATLPEYHSNRGSLGVYGHSLLRDMETEGYQMVERRIQGYSGFGCGNCFIGYRDDGTMAQFTGRHADVAYNIIASLEPNFPRLDVQVSAQFDDMPSNVAKEAYTDTRRRAMKDPEHRRRKVYITVGSDDGVTCYVGSPGSKERGLIYNKQIESKDPLYANTWRWEVRFRNDAADRVYAVLGVDDEQFRVKCLKLVGTWYKERGSIPIWFNGMDMLPLPPERTLPTDIERKLQWLSTQVRPTIEYLQSAGYGARILSSLGLSRYERRTHFRRSRGTYGPSTALERAKRERDKNG